MPGVQVQGPASGVHVRRPAQTELQNAAAPASPAGSRFAATASGAPPSSGGALPLAPSARAPPSSGGGVPLPPSAGSPPSTGGSPANTPASPAASRLCPGPNVG